ncbi:MAG: biopolymer transporter ExbD [Verrucomicrobiae bacterium]
MRFYTRKRRSPVIILVSLIDILAILLIFFIVTTTFRKDQPRLQINLPESKSADAAAGSKEPLILQVKSAEDISLNNEPVTLDSLPAALRAARGAAPDRPIAMQADREAPFGVVVKILDALKQAGIKNIPAFTQPEN